MLCACPQCISAGTAPPMAFGQSLRLVAILAVIGFAAQVDGTRYSTLGPNRISLSSNDTCGSPPASFEALRSDGTTQTMTCNSSSPSEAYPLDHMLDLDVNTRWQTANGRDTVQFVVDFPQAHLVIDPALTTTKGVYRPKAFGLEKSIDHGATFEPMFYLVEEPSQCEDFFGVPFLETATNAKSVRCAEHNSAASSSQKTVRTQAVRLR